jgi:hypothetical protein
MHATLYKEGSCFPCQRHPLSSCVFLGQGCKVVLRLPLQMCKRLRTRSCGAILVVFVLVNVALLVGWIYPTYWSSVPRCKQRRRSDLPVRRDADFHVTSTLNSERLRLVQAKKFITPLSNASTTPVAGPSLPPRTRIASDPEADEAERHKHRSRQRQRQRHRQSATDASALLEDDTFDRREYHRYFQEYVELHNKITDPDDHSVPKRFLIAQNHPQSGICNRILNTLSALLLATVSQRALLIDWEYSEEQRYEDLVTSRGKTEVEAISQSAWEELFVAPPFNVYRVAQLHPSIQQTFEAPGQFLRVGVVCGVVWFGSML